VFVRSISGAVFDQVRNKLPLRYDCLGEQHVKNISEAVRVYRVHPSSTSRAPSLLRRGSWLVSGITHTMLRIFVASVALTAITNAARRSRCCSADGC
jgi:hypothetical protein